MQYIKTGVNDTSKLNWTVLSYSFLETVSTLGFVSLSMSTSI